VSFAERSGNGVVPSYRMRVLKRILPGCASLLAAGALVAGCASSGTPKAHHEPGPGASSAPSSAAPSHDHQRSLARFAHQKLRWKGCRDGFQCATMTVPLDYSHPSGRTIHVAVTRLPASGDHAIGSLVVNPGGPGGSGLQFARSARVLFGQRVRARFDIVGFDPRGVGKSTAVHCLSDAELDAQIHVDPAPDSAAGRHKLVSSAKDFAAQCEKHSGWLLGHVSTLDQARDMDVLRAALGDDRLTYLGESYGTYLGAKYAQLFPHHVRALVLDGALDPSLTTERLNTVQARGFEKNLDDFIADCVEDGSCPLGRSRAAAERGLTELSDRVDAHPLPGPGSRTLGPGEFFEGLAAGLYSPATGWPALRIALNQAESGNGTGMLELSDTLTERQADGHYTNETEANTAISCLDRPAPRKVSAYTALAHRLAGRDPHFGAAIAYGSMTCAFWPVKPVERPRQVHAKGAPPILVIGTTHDPATPYVWARALAGQLDSGRLLTYDGDGHTAYGRGDPCVDGAADSYLVTTKAPPAGKRCS
jgi:pimeloyl-ACP methyl ester carboxylesterase